MLGVNNGQGIGVECICVDTHAGQYCERKWNGFMTECIRICVSH